MKSLHKIKAVESYKGAKDMIKKGYTYPAYVLLKESLRASLAYIQEDKSDKEYSEKTKLKTLLATTPAILTPDTKLEVFNILLDLESDGLSSIISVDMVELEKVRKALKEIIAIYLRERL